MPPAASMIRVTRPAGSMTAGMPHQMQTPPPLMSLKVVMVATPPLRGLLPPTGSRGLSVTVMPVAAAAWPLLTESPAHLRQMAAVGRRLSRLAAWRAPLPLLGLQSASRTNFTPGAAAALAGARSSHKPMTYSLMGLFRDFPAPHSNCVCLRLQLLRGRQKCDGGGSGREWAVGAAVVRAVQDGS